MKVTLNCKKCGQENNIGFKNFNQENSKSLVGKSFAIKCKKCGEPLKFKLQSNG
jgi:hypothetical protein